MSPATAANFGLASIGQIAVPVRDLARAVAFYRDALGMRFLFDVPGRLAFFDCGGVRLMLAPPEGEEPAQPASVIYYKVDDIDAAVGALAARGVAFEDRPHLIAKLETHDLWMTFFRDPEGNLLGLMSEVGRG